MTQQFLSAVTLVVSDYDEAISFFVDKLGFALCDDSKLSETKRWVTVAPPGAQAGQSRMLLAQAEGDEQREAIGNQAGGRVFLFLTTDDFERDYERMKKAGVRFCEEPRDEPYGRVVVFEDLYGNRWDLIEPAGDR